MATTVFLRLRDGRRIRFGRSRDADAAAKVKGDVEQWIAAGTILSMANARGELEEVALDTIESVELAIDPTPTKGQATLDP